MSPGASLPPTPGTSQAAAENQHVCALFAELLPVWLSHLHSARQHSEKAVWDMMNAFSQLKAQHLSGSDAGTQGNADHLVERMYAAFQYQDRLSQMLGLLEKDMGRLQAVMRGETADALSIEAWLQRLQSDYAMKEQHQAHTPGKAPSNGGGDSSETTFF